MKRVLIFLMATLFLVSFSPPNLLAQDSSGATQVIAPAKDSTVATPAPVASTGTNWLADHWAAVIIFLLGLYELVARLVPTVKNISVLSLIMKILASIVPNNKAPDPSASVNSIASLKPPLPTKHEDIT
jgi:hypothetical protein